jgi:hypothetical protein
MMSDDLLCTTDESDKEGDDSGIRKSIFEDKYCTKYQDEKGDRKWRCGWCNKEFSGWNATKALQHLTKQRKVHIQPCRGKITTEYIEKYRSFLERSQRKRSIKKKNHQSVNRSIDDMNESAAVALDSKRRSSSKRPSDASSFTYSTIKSDNKKRLIDKFTEISVGESQQYVQMMIHNGPNPTAELKLTMAVADLVHSCGLPFRLASHPKFRKVITLAKAVGNSYKLPSRNQIATELLDTNYEAYVDRNKSQLLKDIDIFGLSFYGDGATVKRMPLVNVLCSGAYLHTAVMEIRDATSHMELGGKKDARYLASLFRPYIDEYEDQHPNCVDYCTFDGAANVQKSGEVLRAHYPRIVVTHGAEHVLSLFFQDCFSTKVLNVFDRINKKIYSVFGSGAMHGPYAIFQKYSKAHNSGRNIGLIRSAGTRMGGAAISLLRLNRVKEALTQTVNSPEFIQLKVRTNTFICIIVSMC